MNQIQGIIFDMDGLMVDTEPISHQAWLELMRPFGHDIDDAFFAELIGWRTDTCARRVKEAFNLPLTINEIIEQVETITDRLIGAEVPVMAGLVELQAEIERRRLPWAVATASRRAYAEQILDRLGLRGRCRAIAAGDEVVESKPAPDIYLLAAERLNLPPGVCLAFEDSVPGCRAAMAAGVRTVAVPGTHASPEAYDFVPHVFPSLHEAVAHLDTLLNGVGGETGRKV